MFLGTKVVCWVQHLKMLKVLQSVFSLKTRDKGIKTIQNLWMVLEIISVNHHKSLHRSTSISFSGIAFARMLQIWSELIYRQLNTEVNTPAYSTATCSHLVTQAWGVAVVEQWCVFPMAPTQRTGATRTFQGSLSDLPFQTKQFRVVLIMTLKCWNGCCN